MRVLYLSPSGALGGAERVLLNILASVRAADPSAEPYLLALADGPLCQHATRLGVPCTVLPMPAGMAAVGDSQLGFANPGRRWALSGQVFRAAVPAGWYVA